MKLFNVLMLVALPFCAMSQGRKIYYNDRDVKVEKDNASFYVLYKPRPDGKYDVEKRTANGDSLRYTGVSSAGDSVQGEGHYTYYFSSGFVSSEGDFKADKREGLWKHYHDSDSHVWYTDEFIHNKRNGTLTSYYKDGKIKRKEQFADSVSKGGTCWNEDGTEIKFTPFEMFPHPQYNLMQYLSNTIRYPEKARRKSIEGRVMVYFVVNKDGSISDVSVKKGVHYLLDEEAVRVIENMTNWEPGMVDDEKVRVAYTQPITFRLQ